MHACTYLAVSHVKRVLVGLLLAQVMLVGLPLGHLAWAQEANPFKAGVVITEQNQPQINANSLVQLPQGQVLEMTLATVMEAGLSDEGDEFFAKLSHDYLVDGQLVLARGTLVHGMIETLTDAKRAGRDGYINLKLDYLVTPDGREIPIDGTSTTHDGKPMAALKTVGRALGYTAIGGVAGAIVALKYGGVALVAATEGYALAGAAAVGGAVGLTAALITKGSSAHIPEGSELKIKLAQPLSLPTMLQPERTADELALPGLDVAVLGIRMDKDPFGEDKELTLMLDVSNRTPHQFSLFDMALVDEYGTAHYATPFGETGLWFQRLGPNTRLKGPLTFSVDDPKGQHYLVFYQQYSRQPLAKISVQPPTPVELNRKGKIRLTR